MTVLESPDRRPAIPLKVGVESFVELPSAGVTRLIVGGVRSMLNWTVNEEARTWALPAASAWLAWAV